MFSGLLKIAQIAANQNNAFVTHNDAIDALEDATQRRKTNTTFVANVWTVTETDFIRNFVFEPSGATAPFEVKFPDTVNSVVTQRVCVVRNADTTHTATVRGTANGGTTVVLKPGQTALIYQNDKNVFRLAWFDNVTTAPYNVGGFLLDKPQANKTFFTFKTPTAFTLADNFAGSQGHCATNPTSVATFDVKKNGTTIGTVSIDILGNFTFTTTGSGIESFAIGDRLTVLTPTTQDTTLADVTIVFAGTRTI